jgi:DNA-binding NtrC family response regulator
MNRTRVLIVDDDEAIVHLLQHLLKKKDVAADVALSAPDAFALMEHNLYQVVISDINMPDINGIQMLSALKKFSPLVQVIMLTGDSSCEHIVECIDRGAVDFFGKEQCVKLLEAVDAALQRADRWMNLVGSLPAYKEACSTGECN